MEALEATSCTPVSIRVWKVSCALDVHDGYACMRMCVHDGCASRRLRDSVSVGSHELYTGIYEGMEGVMRDGYACMTDVRAAGSAEC